MAENAAAFEYRSQRLQSQRSAARRAGTRERFPGERFPLFSRGFLTLLVGEHGTGKSLLGLELASNHPEVRRTGTSSHT